MGTKNKQSDLIAHVTAVLQEAVDNGGTIQSISQTRGTRNAVPTDPDFIPGIIVKKPTDELIVSISLQLGRDS